MAVVMPRPLPKKTHLCRLFLLRKCRLFLLRRSPRRRQMRRRELPGDDRARRMIFSRFHVVIAILVACCSCVTGSLAAPFADKDALISSPYEHGRRLLETPSWTQVDGDIDGAAGDQSGGSVSMSSDGTRMAIGAYGAGSYAGKVRVYSESGGTWTQVGGDIVGEANGDFSGISVSMSSDGTRVAIGGHQNGGGGYGAGHVRVYSESGGTWSQVGGDIDGEASGDMSGNSVSMSSDGTRVAIGARANDGNGNNAGHVRVYEYDETKTSAPAKWTQVGGDIDSEAAGDGSGGSVSMSSDGTRVAIGAKWNDGAGSNAGHVRVYEYDETKTSAPAKWTKVGGDIGGEKAGDYSGNSVSMSSDGTRVAIGGHQNDGTDPDNNVYVNNAGHVRVYSESGGSWSQVGGDIDGEAAGDMSGYSVSMSSDGTRVAIGARENDGAGSNANAGHVRVYSESGGSWSQVFNIDGEAANDKSGGSVSMSSDGTRVGIGGQYNGGGGSNAGHVRVYADVSPCDASGAITNGALNDCTSSLASGSSCTPTCDSGYTLSGSRSCSSGTLTDTAACTATPCDASAAPTNGALNDCTSSLASGASCTPTCDSGYTLSGSRSCSSGTLTDTVACKADSPAPSKADSPTPSSPTLETAEKAAAEKTRDKLLEGITDEKLKKKAKLLADAAIAGENVKKMTAKLEAADADTACSDFYTKAKLSSESGACVATVSSRRRGRSLAASTYEVDVFFRPSEVTSAQLTDAANSLKSEGVQGVTTKSSVDPIAELKTVDGVDGSTMATFETEADAAAAADTSWAVGLKGGARTVLACASALFVIVLGM